MNIINEFFVSFILIKLYFKFKVCRKIKFPLLWKFYFSKWKFYFSADNITFSQNTLKCLLKDELISLKDNKLYLINSALILENNHTLYSPHSDFKTQLQNRKDLYNDNEHISYAYKINKIEKISILENGISANFTGSFIPLQAQLVIKLQNEELIYEIKPKFNEQLNQQGLISKNISSFNLQNNKLKICLKRQTKHCLEKRILL